MIKYTPHPNPPPQGGREVKQRVIIVHTLEQAAAALAAACELQKPVFLQSAPDAIFYAGSLYLLQMFEQAHQAFPHAQAIFILDCGDAGAETIAAMSAGHKHIRTKDSLFAIQDIAGQYGVTVYTEPYEALDLRGPKDTKDACKQWLEKTA